MERGTVANTVKGFLEIVSCQESDVLNLALDVYASHNLDFVDCVLAGYHHIEGMDIVTFDRKLEKAIKADPITEEQSE